jgi:hypothetical protein
MGLKRSWADTPSANVPFAAGGTVRHFKKTKSAASRAAFCCSIAHSIAGSGPLNAPAACCRSQLICPTVSARSLVQSGHCVASIFSTPLGAPMAHVSQNRWPSSHSYTLRNGLRERQYGQWSKRPAPPGAALYSMTPHQTKQLRHNRIPTPHSLQIDRV